MRGAEGAMRRLWKAETSDLPASRLGPSLDVDEKRSLMYVPTVHEVCMYYKPTTQPTAKGKTGGQPGRHGQLQVNFVSCSNRCSPLRKLQAVESMRKLLLQ